MGGAILIKYLTQAEVKRSIFQIIRRQGGVNLAFIIIIIIYTGFAYHDNT